MGKASNKSKSMWILVRKMFLPGASHPVLVPHADYDIEMFERYPENVPLRIQLAQPRSGPRHRLYRVILRIVVENTNKFSTEDALHKSLLLACNVTEPVLTMEGEFIYYPSSTAFDAMPEDEFKIYFDTAMEIIASVIIPGIDLDQLMKEARAKSNYKDAANDNDERRNEEAA
ncbi:hypothetical protein [Bradyrhizobium ottawaense]|uniref:Uncharacterized protein n=1 Tax=Bradyrhizobium ottawaense TaxID=931866 RepID=A0ABY0QHG1_9BRAD|nr:hypothetical protein [Bradyrhizobium ottawaense]SDK45616.1 hypothetical protein SAMN05444163_8155 [Bradyrhizobium ottawaense]